MDYAIFAVMELLKTYQPSAVEDKWYTYWLENKYFHAKAGTGKPAFSIVIPPPNVTGVLHMGHMLNNTIQDVLVRRARMQGFEACWVPGTDHASIATEAKVVAMLKEQGIKKEDIGREKFLEHAFAWKEKYGGIILEQLKRLGASCDWDRTRFTMEPKLTEAVIDTFISLYNAGLIYRGERMVNWDPVGKTALSDEELVAKEVNQKLYHIRYSIEGTQEYVVIATTRPETIMADSAICVHPNDERYQHLMGKRAIIPLINRSIPIIADDYVAMDFGTGCLKVTPAHDKNDFELGQKHQLQIIDILTESGTLNERAQLLVGEDRFAARKKIIPMLEEAAALVKMEEYQSQVNTSERTGAVVEPRISLQWFVDMQAFMKRHPEVLNAVMDDEIELMPAKFKNTYRHWLENIKDWCISRQLWWGQRIPAWYDESGEFVVAKTAPEALERFAEKGKVLGINAIRQDEDVMDTWFSSWLWPITVFDGIEKPENEDIKTFYPTSVLVTGPDIIFFWVARMIMAGYYHRGEKPFSKVYFTGIVRDKDGLKMSKQLGNSPDVLELMERYGTDGVRMGILLASPAGNDLLFDEAKVEQGRNFCNKIWNAFRLIDGWEVITQGQQEASGHLAMVKKASEWFDDKLAVAIADAEQSFEQLRLSDALMTLYKLTWDDFCSWYLEMIKPAYGEPVLQEVLVLVKERFSAILRLLHPFMPFITEELYHALYNGAPAKACIVSAYPKSGDFKASSYELKRDEFLQVIAQLRTFRNQHGLSPKEALSISILPESEVQLNHFEYWRETIEKLANVNQFQLVKEVPEGAHAYLVNKDQLFVHYHIEVDPIEERARIEAELIYLKGFLESVNQKLNNERFVSNAKPELVEKERQKQQDALAKIQHLEENLQSLGK